MSINHRWTANGSYMTSDSVLIAVESGIADAVDAIIPAETSLYRAGHRLRLNRASGTYHLNAPDTVYQNPWWSTFYDFNAVTWAAPSENQAESAREAFAIHRGWGGDCTLFASIVTTTDLSVWFGLGRAVTACDLNSTQTSVAFASQEILQIYIPGFAENALKWSTWRRVYSVGDTFANGRGFQGHLPQAIRAVGGAAKRQLSLFSGNP